MSSRWQLMLGDVRESLRQLPERSVQCVVTSPPYWGLRDYGVSGQIGLEPTLEEHMDNLSEVFAELRRVLREDGTMWVNYGDAYASSSIAGKNPKERPELKGHCSSWSSRAESNCVRTAQGAGKQKDLLMLPARLALRLQEDGWFLRSEIVWAKPNPMPESVTDRPFCSHEKVFLLTKNSRYYYDADAVREPAIKRVGHSAYAPTNKQAQVQTGAKGYYQPPNPADGRNLRNVWTIPTEAFPGAHFATFPQALVRPCILAGTSERGACPVCGKPWRRRVEVERSPGNYTPLATYGPDGPPRRKQLGWRPTCEHDGPDVQPVPCVVLDPFNGSGTTGVVALGLGRSYIGCELNPDYATIAEERLQRAAKGLRSKTESLDQGSLFEAPRGLFDDSEED